MQSGIVNEKNWEDKSQINIIDGWEVNNWDNTFDNDFRPLSHIRRQPRWQYRVVNPTLPHPPFPPVLYENNLDNLISPLWGHQRWRNLSYPFTAPRIFSFSKWDIPGSDMRPQFHTRTRKALQLATILLHRLRPFLVRVVRQPITVVNGGGEGRTSFDLNWRPTQADYDFLDYAIADYAAALRITWFEHEDGYPRAEAFSFFAHDSDSYIDNQKPPAGYFISIYKRLIDEFDNDNLWNQKNTYERAVASFHLANTLIHELAHGLFWRRIKLGTERIPPGSQVKFKFAKDPEDWEPRFTDQRFAELGHAAEMFLWGAMFITPYDSRNGQILPDDRRYMSGFVAHFLGQEPHLWPLLPVNLAYFFDKTTWDSPVFPIYVNPGVETYTSQHLIPDGRNEQEEWLKQMNADAETGLLYDLNLQIEQMREILEMQKEEGQELAQQGQ